MVQDHWPGQLVTSPPVVEIVSEEEWYVLSVENSRSYRNQLQYLILWTAYNSLTWIPAKFMEVLQAVGEFYELYNGRPGQLENDLRGPPT